MCLSVLLPRTSQNRKLDWTDPAQGRANDATPFMGLGNQPLERARNRYRTTPCRIATGATPIRVKRGWRPQGADVVFDRRAVLVDRPMSASGRWRHWRTSAFDP